MFGKRRKRRREYVRRGNNEEGKEKKGTVTPLNQRPDGAATRGDRNCDARRPELRRGRAELRRRR